MDWYYNFLIVILILVIILILCWYYTGETSGTNETSETTTIQSGGGTITKITPELSNPDMFIELNGTNFKNIDKVFFEEKNENTKINAEFVIINDTKMFVKTPSVANKYIIYFISKNNKKSNDVQHEITPKN
jgi:hypothetical protein